MLQNAYKKETWALIFILVIALLGFIVGIIAGKIAGNNGHEPTVTESENFDRSDEDVYPDGELFKRDGIIELAVPVKAGQTIKQMVQMIFVYFGLIPDAVILSVGKIGGHFAGAVAVAAAVNIVIGLLFFALSPLFLAPE